MITYKLLREKEILLRYAQLLNDSASLEILRREFVKDKPKTIHFAEFFWSVVAESANQDELNNENSEYVQEKTIVTLLAYFRFTVYEEVWKWFQS